MIDVSEFFGDDPTAIEITSQPVVSRSRPINGSIPSARTNGAIKTTVILEFRCNLEQRNSVQTAYESLEGGLYSIKLSIPTYGENANVSGDDAFLAEAVNPGSGRLKIAVNGSLSLNDLIAFEGDPYTYRVIRASEKEQSLPQDISVTPRLRKGHPANTKVLTKGVGFTFVSSGKPVRVRTETVVSNITIELEAY